MMVGRVPARTSHRRVGTIEKEGTGQGAFYEVEQRQKGKDKKEGCEQKERQAMAIGRLVGLRLPWGACGVGGEGCTVRNSSAQRSPEEAQGAHGDPCQDIGTEFSPRLIHNVRDGYSLQGSLL